MLEIKNLKKSYLQSKESIDIFEDLNFLLDKGEQVAIMGKSGSGKSTFLSLISGIIKGDSGEIILDGTPYSSLDESKLNDFRAFNIGFVFQNFHLVSYLNALENVMLPAKVCGIDNEREKAIELLESVGLGHRLEHLPNELSGGERQRVAIARALIHNPKIILADEPSGNLDEDTGNSVMDTLFELIKKNNTTLVLVTHSKEVALRCEKIYELSGGELHNVST
jgi:putative ABC transport system ATP-binding protein